MIKVHTIPSLSDNYIWVIQPNDQHAIIIDPGDAQPVLEFLRKHGLEPIAILVTHKHWDHVDGIEALLQYKKVPVYGPTNDPVPFLNFPLKAGDEVKLDQLKFTVFDTPGHTGGHIAYYGHNSLFCGDTLFGAGCGRLLGGTAEQFLNSLSSFKKLPHDTKVYSTHEYTLANLAFAQTVEPDNTDIQKRIDETQLLRDKDLPSLPSTIELECATNPFLRCDQAGVIASVEHRVKHPLKHTLDVFINLRQWKDFFV